MERTGFEQWKPREVARLLALIETERRYYQEMVAALPVALAILSEDRSIVSSNRAFRRLVGLRQEELRQKTIEQILPSDQLIERIRAAHVEGITAPFFLNLQQRPLRIAATPLHGWEEDAGAETLLLVEDLSGIPPARAAPQPAGGIDLSSFPVVLWQADPSTLRFTYAGGAAEELLGYPASHWLSAPRFFSERINPEDRPEVMALYQSVLAGGGEATAEYRAVSASGRAVWCRETIRVPPRQPGASIAGVMSAIGRRKQLEQHTVAAARVDALRGLAARLAHDLNNPLMIVTGYAEEMQNSLPAKDPARNDVAEILAATARMSELTGHLLDFTRTQAHAPAAVSLNDLPPALAARLRQTAGAAVTVETPAGKPVSALADRDQLEEAILALAARALEQTRNASRLSVTSHPELLSERASSAPLQPGRYACIRIHAFGEGMGAPAGILESFLPGKDATKTAGPAAARAYSNIRQWGGDVAFFSDAAQGSWFVIHLPALEAETRPVPAPAPGPATILIVEDEPGIRALMSKILRRDQYQVLEAASAEEGLATASGHRGAIDVLLTDVVLPGMTGRELAESLRRSRPQVKIVYVSGYTGDEPVLRGEVPPGAKFLQKPFTLAALTATIREALAS